MCFGLDVSLPVCSSHPVQDKVLQKHLKQFFTALNRMDGMPFVLNLSGSVLEWIETRHAEYFTLIKDFIEKKQLEVIGPGYYEPLLPLIPPQDRVGQLEMTTDFISSRLGKRPRGCWITGSAWDSSIISNLHSCGFNYTFLDKKLILSNSPCDYQGTLPVISEYLGKSITIFPIDSETLFNSETPENLLTQLFESSDRDEVNLFTIFIPLTSVPDYFHSEKGKNSWFEDFVEASREITGCSFEFLLPSQVYASSIPRIVSYVPVGASAFVNQWGKLNPKNDGKCPVEKNSIYNFLLKFPEAKELYSKMQYINTVVNQIRGDKERKNDGRGFLYKAQNCEGFWFTGKNGVLNRANRSLAYKNLMEAELISRKTECFVSSAATFDYDGDGLREYLFSFEDINYYIRSYGGCIFLLEDLKSLWNYGDTSLNRDLAGHPGDTYHKKIFNDHLIAKDSLDKLILGNLKKEDTVFALSPYTETSFNRNKRELLFKVKGSFGNKKQEVSLKKKYVVKRGGIQLQLILKNESSEELSGYFATELTLGMPDNFDKKGSLTVIEKNEKHISAIRQIQCGDVSCIRVYDSVNGILFQLENNENSFINILPRTVSFFDGDKTLTKNEELTVLVYWGIELAPNYEMEKTIFFRVERKTEAELEN